MTTDRLVCDPPNLDWSQPAGPRAGDYGDVYFSAEDGLEETRAVFLRGCGLPDAWRGHRHFTVGELGFGTGLNALALWQLWRSEGEAGAWLHFVSVEKHPLERADAARAFAAWPELKPLGDQLLEQWPSALKGAHRCVFADDRFTLTIVHDEAEQALANLEARVDAWFLDGFAPDRNEAMWSPDVLAHVGRLSAPGARIGTFTVAGAVRRGLQAAGFDVSKQPGFGRKRERLEAVYAGGTTPAPVTFSDRNPPIGGRVAVIGAGIAGASMAHALRLRGRDVVLVDQAGPAGGASGAPAGLLTPRLERADRPHVRACLAAFAFARRLFGQLDGFWPEGVLRVASGDAERARFGGIADLFGPDIELGAHGLWMAEAGRFDPARLVSQLIGETDLLRRPVARVDESETGVQLISDSGQPILEADAVVHASGASAAGVLDAITPSAGQLAIVEGRPPAHPVTWGGYVSAAPEGGVMLGATHVNGLDAGPSADAIAGFRSAAAEHVPDMELGAEVLASWSGVRASTPDRLPVVGALPGPDFADRWRALATGRKGATAQAPERSGQFILSGLGSRGFAHAPLLAESLASEICGEPGALERSGREVLHPARFTWRALKRGG